MKVVWITHYPIQSIRGIELIRQKPAHTVNWVINLLTELKSFKEINFYIITLSANIYQDQFLNQDGINFIILKSTIPFIYKGYPPYFPLNAATGFYCETKKIRKIINDIKPDIIHSFGTENAYTIAGIKSGYPCLISMQGIIKSISKFENTLKSRIIRILEKKQIKSGHYFDCRTSFDKEYVRSANPNAIIYHIDRAINPVYFTNHWNIRNGHQLLYVGSIIKRKGIEILIEALSIVKHEFLDIKLKVVGSAESKKYFKYLKSKITILNLINNIEFLGLKSSEEIHKLHLESDLFVFPSFIENSPNAVAEAMITGMPIISSNVGGISSMIDNGRNGILVDLSSHEELALKIIELLKNPAFCQMLGENAWKVSSEKHLPQNVAKKVFDTYENIIRLET